MKQHLIAPSLLAADFGNLERDIDMVNSSQADWLHIDIMDGVFVPNISFGSPVMEILREKSTKPLDVHLMIVQPERYIKQYVDFGAAVITVHYEACIHLHRTIQQIKELGAKAGVALNPHTPVSMLSEILHDIDMVCLMSVNPGFGGQKFIHGTYKKLDDLRNLNSNENLLIQIDGGVDINNSRSLIESGATVLVAGNAVFKANNPTEMIQKLKIS